MDKNIIARCAWLSNLAYQTQGVIAAQLALQGYLRALFFDAGENPNGFATSKDGLGFIVFRGTEKNYADILTDMEFPLVEVGPLEVAPPKYEAHEGFLARFEAVSAAVISAADTSPLKEYVCTGHSLGGAVATLAAAQLPKLDVAGLVTFGSPRVVNHSYADAIEEALAGKIRRYVHEMDIVPRVPVALGYEHVGDAIPLGFRIPDFVVLASLSMPKVYEDHRMAGYVKAVESLYGEQAA